MTISSFEKGEVKVDKTQLCWSLIFKQYLNCRRKIYKSASLWLLVCAAFWNPQNTRIFLSALIDQKTVLNFLARWVCPCSKALINRMKAARARLYIKAFEKGTLLLCNYEQFAFPNSQYFWKIYWRGGTLLQQLRAICNSLISLDISQRERETTTDLGCHKIWRTEIVVAQAKTLEIIVYNWNGP